MNIFLLGLSLAMYFASGISLTIYNKFLVTAAHYGFTFPISLIFVHMCTNCLFSGLALKCVFNEQLRASPFHPRNITRRVFLTQFAPIGVLFGADITLTNVAFRFASVSLTEVVKSAIPALIFLQNIVRGADRTASPTLRAAKVLNVLLMCAGVALTAAGEVGFEMRGFVAAVAATITATLKLVLMENLLNTVTPDLLPHETSAGVAAAAASAAGAGHSSLAAGGGGHDQLQHDEPQLMLSDDRGAHGSGSSSKVRMSPPSPSLRANNGHGGGGNDGLSDSCGLVSSDSMDDLGAAARLHTSMVRRGSSSTPNGSGAGRMFSPGGSSSSGGGTSTSGGGGGGSGAGGGSGHAMHKSYAKVDTRDDGDDDADEQQVQRRLTPKTSRAEDGSGASGGARRSSNGQLASPSRSSPTTTRIDVQGSASPESAQPFAHSSPHHGGGGGAGGRVLVHGVHGNRLHPILSLFYFTPVSAISLLPLQLWLENPRLQSSKFVEAGVWEPTVALVAFGSIMAFALNSSELFVLRETSALTLCIFGVLKFLLVVGISAVVFDQKFTHSNQAGIALTVLALITYNWIKYHEMKDAAAAHAASADASSEPSSPVDVAIVGSLNSGGGGLESVSLHHHHAHHGSSPLATRKPSGGVSFGRALASSGDDSGSGSSTGSNSSVGSVDALLPRTSHHHHPFKQRSSATGSVHPHPANGSASHSGAAPTVEDIGSRLLHAFAAAELLDQHTDDGSDDDALMAALESGQSDKRRLEVADSSETDVETQQ